MIAKNKQDFIENWNDYARQILRLSNSAETLETLEAIRAMKNKMEALIEKVAEEMYAKTLET